MSKALTDAGFGLGSRRSRRDMLRGRRQPTVDEALEAAGIGPGHPSLHSDPSPDATDGTLRGARRMNPTLTAHGLSASVLAGWDVRIEQRQESPVTVPASDAPGRWVRPPGAARLHDPTPAATR